MRMEDTQTRTIAASLFTAPMVSFNRGFVLLVWCSTELWRFATGLSKFVVKVSISRSTRLGPSHLSFEVNPVQGRDYITGVLYFLTFENYMPSIYRAKSISLSWIDTWNHSFRSSMKLWHVVITYLLLSICILPFLHFFSTNAGKSWWWLDKWCIHGLSFFEDDQ